VKQKKMRPTHQEDNLFPHHAAPRQAPPTMSNECNVVSVGKRRDGGTRYWCLEHKADATAKYGKPAKHCRAAHLPPITAAEILDINFDRYQGGVALWGAVPPAYDTTRLPMDRGIHVHTRVNPDDDKEMDATVRAVRLFSNALPDDGIFVSELEAIYYMVSTVFEFPMKYVICTYCGYPHLDRDYFSVHPHIRHLCAGCGRHFRDIDIGVGNPICGAREACGITGHQSVTSKKRITIRQADYPGGIQIWGSNPAFLWTSTRPEEEGIHVHTYAEAGATPTEDETYGEVTVDGITLDPMMVRIQMAQSVLPSIKDRVVPIRCSSCGTEQFSTGEAAFTPATTRDCAKCGAPCKSGSRLRNTIANPLASILRDLSATAPRLPQHHELNLLPETI
jgi:hypothetical protein